MAENNTVDLPSALNLTCQRMGIERLKPKQLEAVEAFVSGKTRLSPCQLDMANPKYLPYYLCCSTCYLVIRCMSVALILSIFFCFYLGIQGSIAVVVTPLISLMMDQREKFYSEV